MKASLTKIEKRLSNEMYKIGQFYESKKRLESLIDQHVDRLSSQKSNIEDGLDLYLIKQNKGQFKKSTIAINPESTVINISVSIGASEYLCIHIIINHYSKSYTISVEGDRIKKSIDIGTIYHIGESAVEYVFNYEPKSKAWEK